MPPFVGAVRVPRAGCGSQTGNARSARAAEFALVFCCLDTLIQGMSAEVGTIRVP